MIVKLIKNDSGYAVGWTMEGENLEEISKLGAIRNLSFFNLGNQEIEYIGRKNGTDNNPGILSWKQKGK